MSAKIAIVPMSTILANNCNLSPRTYLGLPDDYVTTRREAALARIESEKQTLANLDQKVRDQSAFQAKWRITITRVGVQKKKKKI